MGPEEEYASQRAADTIELRIYPGGEGSFTLYEDAGEGYDYEQGQFATTKITYKDKLHQLQIGDTHGAFPGMLRKRVFNIVMVGEGNGVGEGVTAAPLKRVTFLGKAMVVPLPDGVTGVKAPAVKKRG